jgi:DNA-binding winged helix-turn-helix (wHTH) protein
MTPNTGGPYEFAGFVLYPQQRLLTHFDNPINLAGKDLDILLYLVEHAGELITNRDLTEAVWRNGSGMHQGNITNHIAKIRRALNCDADSPRFIKTISGKGYRFIAEVKRTEMSGEKLLSAGSPSRELQITSHLFVPVVLGLNTATQIAGSFKETQWLRYKEFPIEQGRLCILPHGIGVWHLAQTNSFASLTDAAIWRKETYDEILSGGHVLSALMKQLMVLPNSTDSEVFGQVLGKPGYVLSLLVLKGFPWANPSRIRKPLELLSSLTSLETDASHADDLERRLLDGEFVSSDILEFGLPGRDIGFASWDGLSYYHSGNSPNLEKSIVEFEIAAQATWWLSKCLTDVWLAKGKSVRPWAISSINELSRQFARLENIAATETPSQRTMIEAVLSTSRLEKLVKETLSLYRKS